jgi:hypothetical protein
MNYNPNTHLAIARERQADMQREASRREMASLVADDRPSIFARLRARIASHGARQPATGTA